MNKLIFPILAAGTLAAIILKRKARAAQNIRIEPVDIAINSQKTKQSAYTRLYYNIKINAVNIEPVAIKINLVSLKISANNKTIGNIESNQQIFIPARSAKILNFESSLATLGLIQNIIDILQNGINIPINISGFIITDIGRININFDRKLTTEGITGIKKKL